MMKPIPAYLLAAAAAIGLPAIASAHNPWLLPNATFFPGANSWVSVDAAVSDHPFFAGQQPIRIETIKVWAPDGSEGEIESGINAHHRSTFDVKLDQQGTWKIGTVSTMVMGSVKINGEERRVGGRPGGPGPGGPGGQARPGGPGAGNAQAGPGPQGSQAAPGGSGGPGGVRRLPPISVDEIPADATDIKLTEVTSRNEIYVTSGDLTTKVFAPTGKGLEFQPVTHPDELLADEKATFRFLVDGKPAAGVRVGVRAGNKRYRDTVDEREFTTDASGQVVINWPAAGQYYLSASFSDDKPSDKRAQTRRMAFITTVEVMIP